MTEHLPECPMTNENAICCTLVCICDALRACETRVLGAAAWHWWRQSKEIRHD